MEWDPEWQPQEARVGRQTCWTTSRPGFIEGPTWDVVQPKRPTLVTEMLRAKCRRWCLDYDVQLSQKPLATTCWSAIATKAFSELLSRCIGGRKGCAADLVRQFVAGTGLAAVMHRWRAGWPVASEFGGPAGSSAMKLALRMALLEPLMASVFMALQRLLSGRFDVVGSLRASLLKVLVSAWCIWGPVSALQYHIIPRNRRNLVNSLLGLLHILYVVRATTIA